MIGDRLKIGDRFSLVGYSFGSALAILKNGNQQLESN